jgi:hypothetical protein
MQMFKTVAVLMALSFLGSGCGGGSEQPVNSASAVPNHDPEFVKKAREAAAERSREAEEARRKQAEKEEQEERTKFAKQHPKASRLMAKYPNWSKQDAITVSDGQIRLGMRKDMVREAWGKPQRINSSTRASGTTEQWVYGNGHYVYFDERGNCTSLQQSR